MAKHKPANKPVPPTKVSAWIVNSNGQEVEVTADEMEVMDNGVLVFTDGGDLAKAYAPGHWANVTAKVQLAPAPTPTKY